MGWRYISASVTGTSHGDQNLPCQDFSLARVISPSVLFLVASDGAGSVKFSHEGSRLACNTLLEEVTSYVDGGGTVAGINHSVVDRWMDSLVGRLHAQALAMEQPVREFACTLIAAVLASDVSAFLQLGDGCIVGGDGDVYTPITWPAGGEYANTTFFLTDDRAVENLQVQLGAPPVEEVAIFSDGIQMLSLEFSTKRAHAPFFRPLFERLRSQPEGESAPLSELLFDYLGSRAINSRTNDDKTLILASRLAPRAANMPNKATVDAHQNTPAASENIGV